MSEPFIGEIRMFAGNFAPANWAFCDGQLLPIEDHEALFNLIGTYYGGNGQTNFALPDLRGRLPVHLGTGPGGITRQMAESGGTETETITVNQLPAHQHALLVATGGAEKRSPKNAFFTRTKSPLYAPPGDLVQMDSQAIGQAGSSQPHNNLQPFLCISFIISLYGIYPSRP